MKNTTRTETTNNIIGRRGHLVPSGVSVRVNPGALSIVERFFAKVKKTASCWIWLGAHGPMGHGNFQVNGKTYGAHRFSFLLAGHALYKGKVLDHLCGDPRCVNPAHLQQVTQSVNVLRGNSPFAINARKTHCIHGHAFTSENTYIFLDGDRGCRACQRAFDTVRYKDSKRRAYTIQKSKESYARRKGVKNVP